MEATLEGHRRYLAAMRSAGSHRPRVHSHQLAALEREIALAGSAGDLASYLAASGDLFELTRAAWLDRASNHARVATAVGDRWTAEAAAVEHAHGLAARGHRDWGERLAEASERAGALRARSGEATAAFTRLLLALLRLQGAAGEDERTDARDAATAAYRVLRDADPGFAWSEVERQPPYLFRTPWTGSARSRIGDWFGHLEAVEEPVPRDADAGDPLAEIAAAEASPATLTAHIIDALAPDGRGVEPQAIQPPASYKGKA